MRGGKHRFFRESGSPNIQFDAGETLQKTGWAELDITFRRYGFGSVLDMTLTQVNCYLKAIRKIQADEVKAMAIAVRAGMADDKGFKRWIKSVN